MSTPLGSLDLVLKADEPQVIAAFQKGGAAAAAAIGGGNNPVSSAVQHVVGSVSPGIGSAGPAGAAARGGSGGVVGGVVAGITAAAGRIALAVYAIKKLINVVGEVTSSLTGLSRVSGQIAASEATSGIRELMRDMATASVIGDSFTKLRSELDDLLDQLAPWIQLIKVELIGTIRAVIIGFSGVMKAVNSFGDTILSIVESILEFQKSVILFVQKQLDSVGLGWATSDLTNKSVANINGMVASIELIRKELKALNEKAAQKNDNDKIRSWNGELLRAMEALSGGRLNVSRVFYGGGPVPGI